MVVTVSRLTSFDRGFDVEGLVAARVATPPASDPMTFWSVTVILLGAAVAASWIPARNAARLDPARTLAHD